MTCSTSTILLLIFLGSATIALRVADAYVKNEADDNSLQSLSLQNNSPDSYFPSDKRSSVIYVYRRGCIKRGGVCDHRPNECCFSSSCRCNLWGSNCRCQRVGLFQKWG